jgi:hypothetical protein
MNYVVSLTTPQMGKWYHLVGTYDGSVIRFYINGINEASRNYSGLMPTSSSPLYIGGRSDNARYFNGSVDEVAVYNRVLSSAEILDRYNRGASRLKFKVRGCQDENCSGVNFVGPDGTINSFFSDNTSSLSLPSFSFSNIPGNYFQYQSILETDSTLSPKFSSVTVNFTSLIQSNIPNGEYVTTTESCLDLSSILIPDYLSEIPSDPQVGSSEKTYYAIKKSQNDRINVISCSPELQKTIMINY